MHVLLRQRVQPEQRFDVPVFAFRPFRDFFARWMPPGITDKD